MDVETDGMAELLKQLPNPPNEAPGTDSPAKGPLVRQSVSLSGPSRSSDKELPGSPDASPGTDSPAKGPLVRQSVSLSGPSRSSDKELPGSPDASPGTDSPAKGPKVQHPVLLTDPDPNSDKESIDRTRPQDREARRGGGDQHWRKTSKMCRVM